MEALRFSIKINAPKEKVWDILWNDTTYRKWTSVFMEGSFAESDWNEGSTIKFLSPDNSGMFSIIEKKIAGQQMTFKHLGEIKNGVEETKNWEGARESYFLTGSDGTTELNVELDSTGEFKDYFANTFPKAQEKVKQLSEN